MSAQSRKQPPREGVYFVQAQVWPHLVKIGRSVDVVNRVANLRTMSPVELRLLGVMSSGDLVETEQDIHARFARHRRHGEWFAPDPELMSYVANHATSDITVLPSSATRANVHIDPQPLSTAREVADFFRVSVPTIRRLTRRGMIPCAVAPGPYLKYSIAEVARACYHPSKKDLR